MIRLRTRAGDSVGRLLHTHLQRDDDAAEQAFYELNPGLAKHGPVFPAGLSVLLPDLTPPPLIKVLQSWD